MGRQHGGRSDSATRWSPSGPATMVRRVTTMTMPSPDFVTLRGRRVALTDFGGPGEPVLALHGHFGRGRMYAPLAAALTPERRVIALDQRGHGLTGGGGPFTLDEYVADAAALLRELRLGPVPVVAHS